MGNKRNTSTKSKRKFSGNRFTKLNNPEPKTASEKKLTDIVAQDISNHPAESIEKIHDAVGSRIFDITILKTVFAMLLCPLCKSKELYLVEDSVCGLSSNFTLKCDSCFFMYGFSTSQKQNKLALVNTMFVFGLRIIGQGFSSAVKLCSSLNMPCMSSKTFRYHEKKLLNATTSTAKEEMMEAAREVKLHKNDQQIVTDCAVSVDGSWQKRGYSSLNGAVTAISIDTGKILDIEIMSKVCRICRKQGDLKGSSNHQCTANHKGTSGSMEPVGSYRIFDRSIQTRQLRYIEFYGDGDSKGYETVKNVYGEDNQVVKQECIGHVQKRVGTRLRNLKAKQKGIGGKGKLTDKFIDKIQNYYGIAIRSNVNDLQGMQSAVFAAFYHSCSGKDQPMHSQCPKGKGSWCKFQRDTAAGKKTNETRAGLPKDIINIVRPTYIELCDQKLLKKCLHGLTQNPNEAFNGRLWQFIPKNNFVELFTFSFGAYMSLIQFNKGYTGLLSILNNLGIIPGEFTVKGFKNLDIRRIAESKRHSLQLTKMRRKQNRAARKRICIRNEGVEGTTYKSGQF